MVVDFMKDFLFLDEVIKFKNRQPMKFANGRYTIYLCRLIKVPKTWQSKPIKQFP